MSLLSRSFDSCLLTSVTLRPIAICVACSVVCVLGTLASPAKADEPIEMPFVMQTRSGPRNHVHGVSIGSVGPLESKLQAAYHDWFIRFCRAHSRDQQTDRPTHRHNCFNCFRLSYKFTYILTYLLTNIDRPRNVKLCVGIRRICIYLMHARCPDNTAVIAK